MAITQYIINILNSDDNTNNNKNNKSQNVLILVGLNHAIRLFTFLSQVEGRDNVDSTIVSQKYLDLGNNHIIGRLTNANPSPYFNEQIETMILGYFNKN